MYYFDSSALVKLVALEPESGALFDYVASKGPCVSSALARVELMRAIKRAEGTPEQAQRAERVLSSVALVRVDEEVLRRAGSIEPPALRTLDAIHLATALLLGADLSAFVAYHRQLLAAAERHGLTVEAPGLEATL